MWHIKDQTESTSFVAELLKCGNFPSQNQVGMIYKDFNT